MEEREREIQTIVNSLPTQSLNAVNRLRQIGHEAIPALALAIKYPEPVIRAGTARALARMKDPAAVPALEEAIEDPDSGVRLAAILALSDTPGREAVQALARALRAQHGLVRDCAARILARRSLKALRAALLDADAVVRAAAAHGVGYYARDRESVAPLRDLLHDDSPEVRLMAVRSLTWIGMRHSEAVLSLLEALRHADEDVRATAARSIGRVGNPLARGALISALHDPCKRVVLEVIRPLGSVDADVPGGRLGIGSHEALPALREHLQGADADIRVAAAGAAAFIFAADPQGQREPETVALLQRCLADPDARVRAMAASALAESADPGVVSSLVEVLSDPVWLVRASAASALGTLGDAGTIPILEEVRRSDPDMAVSRRAELSLQQLRARMPAPHLVR